MSLLAERFPQYANASAAFDARLVRAVKSGDLSRKAADELTDLYAGAVRALLAEVEAMLDRRAAAT